MKTTVGIASLDKHLQEKLKRKQIVLLLIEDDILGEIQERIEMNKSEDVTLVTNSDNWKQVWDMEARPVLIIQPSSKHEGALKWIKFRGDKSILTMVPMNSIDLIQFIHTGISVFARPNGIGFNYIKDVASKFSIDDTYDLE